MDEITLEYLLTYNFEKTGLEEETFNKFKISGMFSKSELAMLPASDQEKIEELNIKISDYIHDIFGSYRDFGLKCNLNPETIRKTIRVNGKKKISREMLAKFVVGSGLSLEQANELFVLHSNKLDEKSTRLDAVVIHCIQKKLDIDEFFETCKQVGLDIDYKTWE